MTTPFKIAAFLASGCSLVQLFISVTIMQAMDFQVPEIAIWSVCALDFVLVLLLSWLQRGNDRRYIDERRLLLVIYFALTMTKFLTYGEEKPCSKCTGFGVTRLVFGFLEAYASIPLYILAIRQRTEEQPFPVYQADIEMAQTTPPDLRQRTRDTAEDSFHTISLTSAKND